MKALCIAIGLDESSDEISFKNIKSVPLTLRTASWHKKAVLDATLPIDFKISAGGLDLSAIIRVTDDDLFDSEIPEFALDLDLQ